MGEKKNIGGVWYNAQQFADVILVPLSLENLQRILKQPHDASAKMELRMNISNIFFKSEY